MERISENFKYVWLGLGRGTIPLAAWLAPIFLLRFARVTPPFAGLLSIWLVLLVAGTVSNRGVIPLSGFAYFGVVSMIAVALTLSYVADRLLAPKFAGLVSTLIFPLACVEGEFINTRTSPFGSWGSVAYTQYGNAQQTGNSRASVKADWTNDGHQRADHTIGTRFRDSSIQDDAGGATASAYSR